MQYFAFHLINLHYFNAALFADAPFVVAVALITVALFNVALCKYCSILCSTILMLYYLILHYINIPLIDVECLDDILLNVTLFNVLLFKFKLFNFVLFTLHRSNVILICVSLVMLQYFNASTQFEFALFIVALLTVFRMASQKGPLPVFPPVTSTNVGISLQNFLAFSFNSIVTLVQNFKFMPSISPNYWTWNKTTPKKVVFLVKYL